MIMSVFDISGLLCVECCLRVLIRPLHQCVVLMVMGHTGVLGKVRVIAHSAEIGLMYFHIQSEGHNIGVCLNLCQMNKS